MKNHGCVRKSGKWVSKWVSQKESGKALLEKARAGKILEFERDPFQLVSREFPSLST